VNTLINKIALLSCLSIIILSSCSRDEYNILTTDLDQLAVDTIIVEEKVVVRSNGGSTTFNGVYATCEIKEGNYFTEGAYVDPNGTSEENLCYNLTITQVTPFTISGVFSTEVNSGIQREGEFTTRIYSCEALGLDGEEFTEYTDGRLNISYDEAPEEVMMCASVVCEDLFEDQPQTARLLVAGGKLYIDDLEELTIDEEPQFMIIIDIKQDFQINQTLNAYLISDLSFLDGSGPLTYEEFIALGNQITINVSSDKNGYLIGTFEGFLDLVGGIAPANISGTFRSQFTTSC